MCLLVTDTMTALKDGSSGDCLNQKEGISQMSRHELRAASTSQAPRLGISMFRGKSGAGLLLQPEQDRQPAPPQHSPLGIPPQRPPLQSQPVTKKALAGTVLGTGFLLGIIWLLSQSTGQSAYWDHNMRGNADYHRGDYAAAASEYGQMIQINPQRQDGYALQGMAYQKIEQYRLAAQDYRTAMTLTSPDPILYRNLGYVENGYGDPQQAIRDFNAALTLDPTIPDQPTETADAHDGTQGSVKGRMWGYFDSGQYALALKDCNALIAVHPYPASIAVRGKIYRRMGDYQSAMADFRTALGENPSLIFADVQLEDVLGEQGQFASAVDVAAAATKANPSDADVWGSLGWWQYRAGESAQAVIADDHALTLDKSRNWIRYNLGLVYAASGDWEHAEAEYATALRHSTKGEWKGGIVDLQRALQQQPQSMALRQSLRMLLAAQKTAHFAPEG